MLISFIRCFLAHTVFNQPPKRRPDTGQKYRLVGEVTVISGKEDLDHSDNQAELIGAGIWWARKHPYGSATIIDRSKELS